MPSKTPNVLMWPRDSDLPEIPPRLFQETSLKIRDFQGSVCVCVELSSVLKCAGFRAVRKVDSRNMSDDEHVLYRFRESSFSLFFFDRCS